MAVRFGNVLGSSGSVIPKFKEQIARGGPVTVTHPEIMRYFMTIPEAARLVLQAAAIGESGQVLVLDMGEPVRIVDLARDTDPPVRAPADEIAIVFSGLRPAKSCTRNCWRMPIPRWPRRCRSCAWPASTRGRESLSIRCWIWPPRQECRPTTPRCVPPSSAWCRSTRVLIENPSDERTQRQRPTDRHHRRRPAQLHEDRADHPRDRSAAAGGQQFALAAGAHRPALRRPHVGRLLRAAQHSRARRQPRSGLGHAGRADGGNHGALRAAAAQAAQQPVPGRGRRHLDDGLRDRRAKALHRGGARGGRHPLGRLDHARRDQPHGHRCDHQLLLHHQRSGQPEPAPRRRGRRAHLLRRQHDDRHVARPTWRG